MKNRTVNEFENRIMNKRVNIIETSVQSRNKKSPNEIQRLPVQYSVGNDYLYTYRLYEIRKKYVNGEITKEQYEKLTNIVKSKMMENKSKTKKCNGNYYDLEAMKNKKLKH